VKEARHREERGDEAPFAMTAEGAAPKRRDSDGRLFKEQEAWEFSGVTVNWPTYHSRLLGLA
jgi:hypothetical protein